MPLATSALALAPALAAAFEPEGEAALGGAVLLGAVELSGVVAGAWLGEPEADGGGVAGLGGAVCGAPWWLAPEEGLWARTGLAMAKAAASAA
jgi:hypothetical protein